MLRNLGCGLKPVVRPLIREATRLTKGITVYGLPRHLSNVRHKQNNRFSNKFDKFDKSKNRIKIELDRFSPKAKSAIHSIVNKVKETNPRLRVKLVNRGKLESRSLAEIINGLNEDEGIHLIQNEGQEVLIKKIPLREMVQTYSDTLAKEVEQSLLAQGSNIAKKVVKSRERAERKKQSTKIITLNWNISLGDFKLQKKSEICKRVNKGEKFTIYIDAQKTDNSRASERLTQFEDMKFSDYDTWQLQQPPPKEGDQEGFELKRRQLILDQLFIVLEEVECKAEIKGRIHGFLMINCTPKPRVVEEKVVEGKEKKVKKQPQCKPKIEEEDLDALYSFKIED